MTAHAQTSLGHLRVRITQAEPVPLDIDFGVAPSEMLALVGPSGSGKTTTLRTIAGLVRAGSGRITLGSETWLDTAANVSLRPEQRRVGLVFQEHALFPHLDVLGNVRLAMGHVEPQLRDERARGVLKSVGIDQLAARMPRDLSGGERQRTGLARALARDPSVLLLDEPFSAVDRPTREILKREVRALIASLAIPTILVTHDIDDAAALAKRMVVLDHGQTIADGNVHALIADPPTQRIAELIGDAPRPDRDRQSSANS